MHISGFIASMYACIWVHCQHVCQGGGEGEGADGNDIGEEGEKGGRREWKRKGRDGTLRGEREEKSKGSVHASASIASLYACVEEDALRGDVREARAIVVVQRW